MAKVGSIFWIYKGVVFGSAVEAAQGTPSVGDLLDSPHDHVDFWDHSREYLKRFPELADVEYQDVPRDGSCFSRAALSTWSIWMPGC